MADSRPEHPSVFRLFKLLYIHIWHLPTQKDRSVAWTIVLW